MIYYFEHFNATFEDPIIEIPLGSKGAIISNLDLISEQKAYDVEIRLITPKSSFRYKLENVRTPTFDFESEDFNMMEQILDRLNDDEFKVK